ncbi:Nif3-like dinuclear metal center hexameric protein [Clostridium ganghwense]|uniref:GTP cyclohydrolase 1 type 2 homolog n=1 Tax=Clostridium ganghwense TaxID=312089 RepID=A0ABT4CRW0_9CLOT|nr:Nif3-like dinuclear metal center hexameric protein [Clostridium ganghwense]MCY6371800.1 Nif3-like dinuclear metal center hexameric protein [Clostridium ganghwense]
MSLKVKDIKNIMEEFAPIKFKESYDNVGLMVGDSNEEVTSILVALDCTLKVIEEAKKKKCNLILTHHPLLFRKPSSITTETLFGKKIIELIRNNISVYSSHTNLDSVKGGINDVIMDILGFEGSKTIDLSPNRETGDNNSGIGRVAELDKNITLKELCCKIKAALGIPYLRYAGEDSMTIKKIAVINGSGQDYFYSAKKLGADCILTGDTTYHYVSDYSEEGIGIIDAGHFGTEWACIKVVAKKLENRIKEMGFNNDVIISESTKDPYKFK